MDSISQNNNRYKNICKLAASTDEHLNTFKSNNQYKEILEHTSYNLGMLYLDYINQNFSEYSLYLDQFKLNDQFGGAELYNYPDIGSVSPSTLRYIKVAGDIYNIFYKTKNIDLNKKRIIEIGCGYGGQCFILSQIFNFNEYYIVDIPEAQHLTKRYLNKLNTKCTVVPVNDLPSLSGSYDLVISNYAYSELDKEFQDFYYEHILQKSSHGYLTLNFISHLFNIDSYNKQDLIYKLNEIKPISMLEETPKTFENNLIIYF